MSTESFDVNMARGGDTALLEVSHFLTKSDVLLGTINNVAGALEQCGILYAITGDMALVAHGVGRATSLIEILVAGEDLETARLKWAQSRGENTSETYDTEAKVHLRFITMDGFPGDGKPKPVAFPDPATCAVVLDGKKFLNLNTLIELKLASGMTNPGRLKDLADVQELIRIKKLTEEYALQLNPYVREKFIELQRGVAFDSQ